ncbi:MAG: tetratricopeptide repeat protein [Deltaproteobacteria bacterium]|nr:tetratricopeptide repeat protein [Deltaproteobacteria bacterium]
MAVFSECQQAGAPDVNQELEQTVVQALQQAEQHQLSGEINEAEELYRGILEVLPNHPDANHNFGVLLEQDKVGTGLSFLHNALKEKPECEHYWLSYISALIQSDQIESASQMLDLGRNHGLQGVTVDELASCIQAKTQSFATQKSHLSVLSGGESAVGKGQGPSSQEINKLERLQSKGQTSAAITFAKDLTVRYPGHGLGWKVLGQILEQQERIDDALQPMQKALELLPEDPDVHNVLGVLMQKKVRLDEAGKLFCRALDLRPDFPAALSNLGNLYRGQGRLQESETCFRRALKSGPNAAIYNNLGANLLDQRRIIEAEDCYRHALKIQPDSALAHINLGVSLRYQGRLEEAIASQRRALKLDPDCPEKNSHLLFTMNYTSTPPKTSHLEEARKFGRMVGRKVKTPFSKWHCEPQPQRLRIGFVSGDLYNHPVGFFLESLLGVFNRDRVELVAYPTKPKADGLTARIKPYFDAWAPLYGLSDEAAAHMVHKDGVHILIDLSGHTSHNRLPMFAWKPAPVQASWLGYFATTGLPEIDYFLADEVGVPETQRANFTETLWYLPDTRLCFSAPELDLPVAPLPALENGYITFGCFQMLTKVGDAVLGTWNAVLNALPTARLRWQCAQFNDQEVVAQTFERLQRVGIDPARVKLHGSMSRADYLASHAEADMILDTFPYPGGTTTCEALWMGVPTLTLAGDTLLSRQGASLLTAAGLEDWIAASEAEYIDKAVAKASELQKLAFLRAELRSQVLESPLFDASRFAHNFEDALWAMWRKKEPPQSCLDPNSKRPKKEAPLGKAKAPKTFLHVGCGPQRKDATTKGFNTDQWCELRLDINEAVNPDIVGTMTDMSRVADASVDAIFSSHNIEHLYPHDVPLALKEFLRVLKDDGFTVITCPDLKSVCALVAEDKLCDPAYQSAAGPIAPLDILYGHRASMARGNIFMAHRCGFTEKVLSNTLKKAGFMAVATMACPETFDLWAIASKSLRYEDDLRILAAEHFVRSNRLAVT